MSVDKRREVDMSDFDSVIRECQKHKCPRKNVCGFEDRPAAMGGFFCWGCGKQWLISTFADSPSEPYHGLLQGTREDGLAFHQLLNDKGVFVPLDEQEVSQGCAWAQDGDEGEPGVDAEGCLWIWEEYELPKNPLAAIQAEEDVNVFEAVREAIRPEGRMKVTHEIPL